MLRSFLFLVLAIFLSNLALAEESAVHENVLVEASSSYVGKVNPELFSGHVTVISSTEFDTKVATVADVLRNEAGVQIRQIGGLGSFSTINIRGSNSKQVNVYLDGVLLNGAFGGAVDLSQFALDNVEEIQIYRGNAPVTLGFSGIGGAVNIKTRDYTGTPVRQVKLALGSFTSKNAAVSLADEIGGTKVLLSSEYLSAENDFGFENNNLTPSYTGDDFSDRRNNADFSQFTTLLSLKRSLGNKTDASLVSQFFDKNDHFPDVYNSEDKFAELKTDFFSTQVKIDHRLSHQTSIGAKLFASKKGEYFKDEGSSVGVGKNEEDSTSSNYGFSFLTSHSLESHLLSANFEAKVENYSKKDFVENTDFKYKRIQSILGIEDEWISEAGAWQINFGGRFFRIVDESYKIGVDTTRTYENYHLGLMYYLSNSIQIYSNISRNIRLPQLFELYGDRGLFKGNNELLPERALNGDMGVKFQGGGFSSKASIFYRYLSDGIFLSYGSSGVGKAVNISKSKVFGFEVDSSLKLSEYLSFNLKSTLQDSLEITDSSDRDGNSLPGIYTLSNYISSSIAVNKLVYKVEYRHQSGGFFDISNDATMPNQDQVNVSARWSSLSDSIEFRVDNITDNNFLDFNRYPMPGRRLFVVYKRTF